MYSSLLLSKQGLVNGIAGADFNFRYQRAGNQVVSDVNRLIKSLQIDPIEIYTGQQTHSANIEYVDGNNGEEFVFGQTFKNTDGLITDQPNIGLLIKFADCTPVVLYDPIQKVQASVHSGWRGTVQKISAHAIEKMVKDFGCNRTNILAYLGPSIDQDHYEVGPEVYEAFSSFDTKDHFFKPKGEKYQLSMLDANLEILRETGIKEENIEVERTSTFIEGSLHSARQEGAEYRLNAILTMIRE